MRFTASAEKKRAHCRSSVAKLATTSASTASVHQQAAQRRPNRREGIGGGPASAALVGAGVGSADGSLIPAPCAVAR